MKASIKLITFILTLFITVSVFSQTKSVYMVSTAHLDSQWNWTVQNTIATDVKKTLVDNFSLFNRFPLYKFNFEGAIKYMWAKEYFPDLYDTLKHYIANGRWHITGSSLDANDVNLPSPESFIRNILLGQTFYKNEFNKKSNDIFLPDCFGFGYTLPSIAKHCGLIGFSSQKLTWGSSIPIPFDFGVWQGVDGAQIMAALNPGAYTSTITSDLSNNSAYLTTVNSMGTQSGHYVAYKYYGTGDQGGAPDSTSVSWLQTSINGTGPLKILAATSDSLYESFTPTEWADFSHYNGELLMATHGTGCYTSHTAMKRWNRKNEILGAATERSAVMAQWLGGLVYPTNELNQDWTKLIWHQFHDDLTGTSLPAAYTFSENDEVICQNEFCTTLTNASGAVVKGLNTQTVGNAIIVYNPLSIQREDIVEAYISATTQPAYIRVYNGSGVEVPAQILSFAYNRLNFLFVANVKSLSYEVFDVRTSTTPSTFTTNLAISNSIIENAVYKITINTNGDVSSILDKRFSNKELLATPVRLGMFTDQSNTWPSWEIQYSAINVTPQNYVDGTPTFTIVENGLVRVSLKITRVKGLSTFDEYIRLTNWGPQDRIDFVNTVDWKTKNTLLKAIFPLSVSNPNATYDLGLGAIQRSNNTSSKYEVPAQQWADLSSTDSTYGVSIFNDCKYGWDKPANNTLRLTLIHTPGVSSNYTYQQNQDLYKQQFTYSIYGHDSLYYQANTVWEAEKLNQPLLAFEAPKHSGVLGKSFSIASVNTTQAAIKALKKAESSSDFVVRVYETKGLSDTNVSIKFCSQILSANELNGIEETIGSANFAGDSLQFSMTAFQPKTFSVRLAPPSNPVAYPVSNPLNLYYDDDAITYDSTRFDGDFDGNKISYAAELLPDTIYADGIAFKMGPKYTGAKNIIRCNGNEILFNQNPSYKKLYLLCASSSGNQNAVFFVNGVPDTLKVPYFSSFIGQAGGTYSSSYFNTDNTAWIGTHRHNGVTNINEPYVYTYLFKYCINLPPNATQLILPVNNKVALFAATLANNENDDITTASNIMDIPIQDTIVTSTCSHNYTLHKTATASGQCATTETPDKAVDGDEATKWCHNVAGNKWLQVDMGDSIIICRWRVVHAGSEGTGYITKNFQLQRIVGGNWVAIDSVTGNTTNITDRSFTPCQARNVRLLVTNSGSDNAARIYELQVFGAESQNQPYSNIAHIPGVIEAENYDLGGEGIAYHDSDAVNQGNQYRLTEGVDIETCSEGGYDVFKTYTGEWMKYSVFVDSTAYYRLQTRLASALGYGKLHFEVDDSDKTGIINVQSTGGNQMWLTANKDIYLTKGQHLLKVYIDQSMDNISLNKYTFIYSPTQLNGNGDGLSATYFNGINFDTLKVNRVDTIVNFEFMQSTLGTNVNPSNFSSKWMGKIEPRFGDNYTFYISSNQGIRLWINNVLLIDKWNNNSFYTATGQIQLNAWQKYDIRIDYFNTNSLNTATCILGWSSANQWAEVVPKSQLYTISFSVEEFESNNFKIYPNPGNGKVTIMMDKAIDADIKKQNELNASWEVGANTALEEYMKKVTNVADQTNKAMTGAFQGMEDALVNFVQTGKLDFSSLANSIIADMIR
ncbi:MAG: glycoside hydrolase family 38 C-terminal domain-containing protein, partial [Bacteroidota bacterium]